MAITITRTLRSPFANRRSFSKRATLGAYATGGITVTAAELGVPRLEDVSVQLASAHGLVLAAIPVSPAQNGTFTSFKIAAYRIPALDGNSASAQNLAEVANAADLGAVAVTIFGIAR